VRWRIAGLLDARPDDGVALRAAGFAALAAMDSPRSWATSRCVWPPPAENGAVSVPHRPSAARWPAPNPDPGKHTNIALQIGSDLDAVCAVPDRALLGCSSTDDRYYFPNTRYIGSSGDFAPTFTVSDLSEDTMLVRYPLVKNDEERQLQQGAGRVTPLAMAACPRTPGQRSSGSSAAATWR
jgi:hypothetical protein